VLLHVYYTVDGRSQEAKKDQHDACLPNSYEIGICLLN
jgi:hypothetical protein